MKDAQLEIKKFAKFRNFAKYSARGRKIGIPRRYKIKDFYFKVALPSRNGQFSIVYTFGNSIGIISKKEGDRGKGEFRFRLLKLGPYRGGTATYEFWLSVGLERRVSGKAPDSLRG